MSPHPPSLPNSYHTHIAASGLDAMVEAASAAGLAVLGVSEHIFQLHEGRRRIPEAPLEGPLLPMAGYVAQVRGRAPSGVTLRLGLEVDFLPDRQAELAELCDGEPWDFLIVSVHALDGCLLQRLQAPNLAEGWRLWRRYADLLEGAVRGGGCDILAHPLRLSRFVSPPPYLEQCLRPVLEAAAQVGVAVELNGADVVFAPGLQAELLAWCRSCGAAVSFGADAHGPGQIARGAAEALVLLRRAGYAALTGLHGRRPVAEPLPPIEGDG